MLLDGGTRQATLFPPARNELREKAEGPVLFPDELAEQLTGIPRVLDSGQFTETLARFCANRDTVYTPLAPQEPEAMSRDLAQRYKLERMNDPWDDRSVIPAGLFLGLGLGGSLLLLQRQDPKWLN